MFTTTYSNLLILAVRVLLISDATGIAKAGEYFDAMAYHYTGIISGHSIKHLAAGMALFMVYLILRRKHA